MSRKKRRIRIHLLVLLWIWGLLMFVVVDLFRGVDEFDRIRPQWRGYQLMRLAAHRIAGAACEPSEFTGVVRTTRPRRLAGASALRAALDSVDRAADFDPLASLALGAGDPRVRIRAMRALATRFGSDARDVLVATARDKAESEKVRAQAARYLGQTGDDAWVILNDLAQNTPVRVRSGARVGLAELGTGRAVRTLAGLEAAAELERVANAGAVPALGETLGDQSVRASVRVACCRALGNTRSPAAIESLTANLEDRSVSPAVRAAAVEALGRLGRRTALTAVERACSDVHAAVAREAHLARQRLRYAAVD